MGFRDKSTKEEGGETFISLGEPAATSESQISVEQFSMKWDRGNAKGGSAGALQKKYIDGEREGRRTLLHVRKKNAHGPSAPKGVRVVLRSQKPDDLCN